jgi:hypothetical protein
MGKNRGTVNAKCHLVKGFSTTFYPQQAPGMSFPQAKAKFSAESYPRLSVKAFLKALKKVFHSSPIPTGSVTIVLWPNVP